MVQYTVNSIVKEYLAQIGDTNMGRFMKFKTIAVSGIRQWHMDVTGVPNVVTLDVSSTDRAPLPFDYLNYTKIGICGADGVMYPLAENNNICLDRNFDACGNESTCESDYSLGGGYAYTAPGFVNDHWRNGEMMGRFFGIGGGQNANGYFKIDTKNGEIVLKNLLCSVHQIELEYISDITAVNGDFAVHPFMLQTLKYWIYYQALVFDRNAGESEKAEAERRYNKEYRVSKKRFSSTPLSEWYRAIRSGNNAAVKF